MDSDALATQLAEMQAQILQLKGGSKHDDSQLESIWAVFNPSKVSVWCEKSNCPVTGRRTSISKIELKKSQTLSASLDGEDIESVTEDDDSITEVNVLRDEGPKFRHHPMGVVASFRTHRGAQKYIETYYRANQDSLAAMNVNDVPLFEIAEIHLS